MAGRTAGDVVAAEGGASLLGRPVDSAPARPPGRDIRLDGAHVRLVPIDPDAHAQALWRDTHGPGRDALWAYLSVGPFPEAAALRAHLATAAGKADPLLLAILDRRSGEAVGHAAYMRAEPAHRVIEVGNLLFGPALQRAPGGTEAMFLMARHAFEVMGFRRYEWKCNALNAASRRAAERYGFTFEGLFRDHMIVKGRSRDTAWFSMLGAEWPARRRAFETWLDPSNFDAAGRQRLGLSALNARAIPGHALRRAGPDDAARFEALQARAYAWNRSVLGLEPMPLLVPASQVLDRYETWLSEDGGALQAALALEPSPDGLLIWSVSVDPDRQNGGIGRRLLTAAEDRTRALGLSMLRLYTGAPLTKNIDWYRRRGYAVERVEDMADRQAVHMVKHI